MKKHLKKYFLLYLFIIFVFLLKFHFRSLYLEDWDSVQFALGIHEFSVLKHQPHPPGYPLYILISKMIYFFTKEDNLTLTLESVLASSLTLIPLYFLAEKMFDRWVSLLTVVIFTFTPISFYFSEVAMSNLPGLLGYSTIAFLVYKYKDKSGLVGPISFLAGLTLGIRFSEFPIIGGLICFLLIKNLNIKRVVTIVISFMGGFLVWFGAVIYLTGWTNFNLAGRSTKEYVAEKFLANHNTISTTSSFVKLFLKSYTFGLLLLIILAIVYVFRKKERFFEDKYLFLIFYTLPYLAIFYLLHLTIYYDLGLSQYTLAILPPLSILASAAIMEMVKKTKYKLTFIILISFVIGFSFLTSLKIAKSLHEDLPVTIEPVMFVKENVPRESTTLVTTYLYRQFQYYAPEYDIYFRALRAPGKIDSEYVVVDFGGLIKELPQLKDHNVVMTRHFEDKKLIFARVNKIDIFVLRKKSIGAEK